MKTQWGAGALAGAILALIACRNPEAIRQTMAEIREKPRLEIQIRLPTSDLPTPDELMVQRRLEDRIEQQHIGTVVKTGSAPGSMNVVVEVESTVNAIPQIRSLLQAEGILDRSVIKVLDS